MAPRKKPRRRPSEESERSDRTRGVGRREVIGQVTELDPVTRESTVCDLFTQGLTVPQILDTMEELYPGVPRMRREQVYRIVRRAARDHRLVYTPDADDYISRKILEAYGGLTRAHVVRTAISTDVARETANLLIRLVRERHQADEQRNEVHIGFAAGLSTRQVAQAFARLLSYPTHDLPKSIVFHAMVAGHDLRDPTTDPNAYFSFFLNPSPIDVTPRFMGFHAPAMVRSRAIRRLRLEPEIREAYDAAKELDIIVTSGSDWEDPHSALRFCMERSPESVRRLLELKVIGDMLWRPLGMNGPILYETDVRALTVMELSELPGFIRDGKRVLLMLGPCGFCGRPKGKLLHAILSQKEQLVSHLVVDTGTAVELGRAIRIL